MNTPTQPHPWGLVWRMTRPGFLTITAVACLLGTATAYASTGTQWGATHWLAALAVLGLALVAHAAANVLNDYHDALNGADAANQAGLFPFTGGSRLIQNGVVTLQSTRRLALALMALVVPAGILLSLHSGPALLLIGVLGLGLAWAYSAPPLALMSRGLGELTVAASWWLVVVGADFCLRRDWSTTPAVAGLGLAGLVANILLINGLPDAPADAQVGKRTLAVRLGPRWVTALYGSVALLSHAVLLLAVWRAWLPQQALWGLLSAPLALAATLQLLRQQGHSAQLRPAIGLTIAATTLHGLGQAAGLWLHTQG